MTITLFPTYKGSAIGGVGRNWHPYLHCVSRYTIIHAEVEAGLAFRNETDPVVSVPSIGDELGLDSRPSHCDLFSPSPAVRVAEDENYVLFDRFPDRFPKRMGFLDIGFRANEQISHEVGKHVNDGNAMG